MSYFWLLNSSPARQFVLDLFVVFEEKTNKQTNKQTNKSSKMPLYKSWDVKRETRKAVAAGILEECPEADELFCCLISEIQRV